MSSSSSYLHHAIGLNIRSCFPLPELLPAVEGAGVKIEVTEEAVPVELAGARGPLPFGSGQILAEDGRRGWVSDRRRAGHRGPDRGDTGAREDRLCPGSLRGGGSEINAGLYHRISGRRRPVRVRPGGESAGHDHGVRAAQRPAFPWTTLTVWPLRHLVTGCRGFLGNSIARRFPARGDRGRVRDVWEDGARPRDIEFINADIRERAAVTAAMRDVDVVHSSVALVN